MRQENAPKENIERMIDVFRAEMIYRTTWMLAEYLDTPARIEAALQSVLAASARVHGDKLGRDVLGNVTTSFNRLRGRLHEDSTQQLANGLALDELASHLSSAESNDSDYRRGEVSAADILPVDEPVLEHELTKNKNKKHKSRRVRQEISPSHDVAESVEKNVRRPNVKQKHAEPISCKSAKTEKDNKISSSWRWDIDPSKISPDAILECFVRPSDLFAYHALPIASSKLGREAQRKTVRSEIQSMMNGMPGDEYIKWVESFNKLCKGDMEMLLRPEQEAGLNNHQMTAPTPAPIDTRFQTTRDKPHAQDLMSHSGVGGKIVSAQLPYQEHIKSESQANTAVAAEQVDFERRGDPIAQTTAAFRQMSTEGLDKDQCLSILGACGRNVHHTGVSADKVSWISVFGPDKNTKTSRQLKKIS